MTLGQISHLPQGLHFSNDVFKSREDLAWLAEKYIQNRKPFHYKMYRPYRHTGTPTIFDKSYTNKVLESVSFLKSLSNSKTTNENIQNESMKVVSPVEHMELGNRIHLNVLEYTTKKMEDVIPAEQQQITETPDYSDQSTESATVEPTINGYRPIITPNYKDLDQYTATTASSYGDMIYTTTTEDGLVPTTEAESSTTEIVDTLNFTNKDLDESAEPIAPEIEYVSEHNAREEIGEYNTDETTEHPTNPPSSGFNEEILNGNKYNSAEIKIVSADKHEESTNLIYELVYPTKSLNLQKSKSRTPTSPIVELLPSPEVFVLWKDPTL